MATVPRVTRPSVAPQPIDPGYQRVDGAALAGASGAGSGAALERAGVRVQQASDDVGRLAIQMQLEDNEREVKKADIAYSERLRVIGFGDGTPQNQGYYATKGEASIGAYGTTRKSIQDARKEIADGISNARARQLFLESTAGKENTALEGVDRFHLQQRRVADNTVSEARLKEAGDAAAVGWNDPKVMAGALAVVNGEITTMASREGWAPEVTASKLQEYRTAVLKQAIANAMVVDPSAAKKLYDQYKALIDGTSQAAIEKDLNVVVLRKAAQDEVDRIMATPKLSDARRIEEAKKLKDPQLRDEVQKRVEHEIDRRHALWQRGETEANKAASGAAFKHVWSGGTIQEFADKNPAAFARLSANGTTLTALMATENRVALGQQFAPRTDGKTLDMLRRMPVADLAQVDPQMYQALLTPAEFNAASGLVAGAQKQMDKVQSNRDVYDSGRKALLDFAPKKRAGGKETLAPNDEQMNMATNEMAAWIASKTAQGKLPTQKEINEKAAELMLPTITSTGIFGTGFAANEGLATELRNLTPKEKARARIPYDKMAVRAPEYLSKLKKMAEDHGVEPTPRLLEELAAADQLNDEARLDKLLGGKFLKGAKPAGGQ